MSIPRQSGCAACGPPIWAETWHDTRRVLSDLLTRLDRPLPVETA
ncbi:hypothetical protein [Magnetospirillum aberrantis]|nr:hypothetical protein [Magnetospirillum aberrantis]